jgi:hypothetical protein
MKELRRTGLAALVVSTSLGLAATPARADQAVRVDVVGDATAFVYDISTGEGSVADAVGETGADIVRVRFSFNRHHLVVVGSVRQLDPRARAAVGIGAGSHRYDAQSTRDGGVRVLVKGSLSRCVGGSARTVRRTQSYKFVIPVDCFGSPPEARFAFGVARGLAAPEDQAAVVFDDAHRDGARKLPDQFRLGAPVKRG